MLDEKGELIGVVSLSEALNIAGNQGVDLVEISPNADPPVCKVIDYGKMIYAQKKKEQQAKKLTKAKELKGIRITFRIGPGDLERQRKLAEEFLTKGHPVRVQLVMKGREKAHRDIAFDKMKNFLDMLKDVGTPDQNPRGAGHQIIATLRPAPAKKEETSSKD